jgi:hypothetical protein
MWKKTLLGLLKAKTSCQVHDSIGDHVADAPTFVLGVPLDVRQKIRVQFSGSKLVGKANTAVDTLHAHTVLVVLVELAKNVKQVAFRNFGDKLNHLVEYDACLFSDLWQGILRNFGK